MMFENILYFKSYLKKLYKTQLEYNAMLCSYFTQLIWRTNTENQYPIDAID